MAKDKFVSQEGEMEISQCAYCIHWLEKPGPYCTAFPETKIPSLILSNKVSHKDPYKGDHGIQFERRVK